uniref:AP complex mu/sigma subunit domain-containing protein n=1 Tax=Panthera tigris altaica TaxID=74533 RepID=A0A8C9JRP3_PANTA
MIKAILIFNNHGKQQLSKFYQPYTEDTQQQIIRETFHLVSKRDENVCNFLDVGLLIGRSENTESTNHKRKKMKKTSSKLKIFPQKTMFEECKIRHRLK